MTVTCAPTIAPLLGSTTRPRMTAWDADCWALSKDAGNAASAARDGNELTQNSTQHPTAHRTLSMLAPSVDHP